jgi:di/tricarboxylate transporter
MVYIAIQQRPNLNARLFAKSARNIPVEADQTDPFHVIIDFTWLLTAIALAYFGIDVHTRLSQAHKETTVSKSMIVVGILFFLLALYHIHEDLLGAEPSMAIHLVPIGVLAYGVFEYRRLVREARSASFE